MIKNLLKNKVLLGAVCILIGLLIAFVGAPLFMNLVEGDRLVVRAKTSIPAGSKIESSMLETVKMGRKNLPEGTESKVSAVAGKYATSDISAGDLVTDSKTAAQGGIYNLKDGQLLFSVTIKSFADGLSGKLANGDIVTVYVPLSASGNGVDQRVGTTAAQSPAELQYVEVAAVTASNGADVKQKSASGSNSDNIPATVTLIVNKQQAQILAGLENGTVHLALVNRDNQSRAQALLKAQNDYFTQSAGTPATSGSSSSGTSSGSGVSK